MSGQKEYARRRDGVVRDKVIGLRLSVEEVQIMHQIHGKKAKNVSKLLRMLIFNGSLTK